MPDTLSPEARSRIMSSIRSKGTRPELYVRKRIWSEGFRYRLHVKTLPGTPDLVLSKYRMAIFVHGCFWHQHDCSNATRPSSNREYWDRKFDRNIVRDALHRCRLDELDWEVVTVWECNLENGTKSLLAKLKSIRNDR